MENFEAFIRNARTDIYNLICSIYSHKKNPLVHDDGSSGVDYPIPFNSTTEALFSLNATINFIG